MRGDVTPLPFKFGGFTLPEAIAVANKVALRTGVRQRVTICRFDLCEGDPVHFVVNPVEFAPQREFA